MLSVMRLVTRLATLTRLNHRQRDSTASMATMYILCRACMIMQVEDLSGPTTIILARAAPAVSGRQWWFSDSRTNTDVHSTNRAMVAELVGESYYLIRFIVQYQVLVRGVRLYSRIGSLIGRSFSIIA